MKTLLVLVASVILLASSSAVFAGTSVPSLVGTWDVKAEGAYMSHGGASGKYTHWSKGQTKLTAVVEVLSQDGRVIRGIFKGPKKNEPFIAVIGYDGNLYLADEDGGLDGRIVNKNRIEAIYRHVTPQDTVISASVWTRRK